MIVAPWSYATAHRSRDVAPTVLLNTLSPRVLLADCLHPLDAHARHIEGDAARPPRHVNTRMPAPRVRLKVHTSRDVDDVQR